MEKFEYFPKDTQVPMGIELETPGLNVWLWPYIITNGMEYQ